MNYSSLQKLEFIKLTPGKHHALYNTEHGTIRKEIGAQIKQQIINKTTWLEKTWSWLKQLITKLLLKTPIV